MPRQTDVDAVQRLKDEVDENSYYRTVSQGAVVYDLQKIATLLNALTVLVTYPEQMMLGGSSSEEMRWKRANLLDLMKQAEMDLTKASRANNRGGMRPLKTCGMQGQGAGSGCRCR